MLEHILVSPWYNYLILPLLIFLGRIIDVSLGTIRVIFVAKGFRKFAPFLSFFEILIWILVIRQIFTNLTNPITFVAYALGFATGTYIGMRIEEKLSVGQVMIRIITEKDTTNLLKKLKEKKYGITVVRGKGSEKKVVMIFSVIERKELSDILKIINKFNPKAFYSIEDVRFAHEHHDRKKRSFLDAVRGIRKGK